MTQIADIKQITKTTVQGGFGECEPSHVYPLRQNASRTLTMTTEVGKEGGNGTSCIIINEEKVVVSEVNGWPPLLNGSDR